MKGLVLCAGKGTRLAPVNLGIPKPLVNLLDRPTLAYALDRMSAAGAVQVGLVISEEWPAGDIAALQRDFPQLKLTTHIQKERKGTAHAVLSALPWVGESPLFVLYGDNWFGDSFAGPAQDFLLSGEDLWVGVKAQPLGSETLTPLTEILLKGVPGTETPPKGHQWALTGSFFCSAKCLKWTAHIEVSPQSGELEWPRILSIARAQGLPVRAFPMSQPWEDMGTPHRLLRTQAALLAQPDLGFSTPSTRTGQVWVGPGVQLHNVDLKGPAWIGAGCVLENVWVGPNVCVGAGSRLSGVRLVNTLLGRGARIEGGGVLIENSVTGPDTHIRVQNGCDLSSSLELILAQKSRLLI